MFKEELQRAVETAPRDKLDDIVKAMWAAYSLKKITDTEAGELLNLVEARKGIPAAPTPARRPVGSRPRTGDSMERRRHWAASGRMPPGIQAKFTTAEAAALAVVAVEVAKRGACTLAIGAIAAIAGISETTVRRALHHAKTLGFVKVEERRISRFRNETNIISIVSTAWTSWLRLSRRREGPGGGYQSGQSRNTGAILKDRQRAAGIVEEVSDRVIATGRSGRLELG